MTIETILLKEPRLLLLFDECKKIKKLPCWEKNQRWCHKLKPRMMELVGFDAEKKELATAEIYDAIYRFCIDLAGI